ncbi:M20/M25/M40 family metallo-hydrolase, partial [uncultured Cetobacterium sp.]
EYTEEVTNKIVDFLMIVPDGVQYMSKDIKDLVQTSLNNGVLEEKDGKLNLTIALRSAVKSSLYEFINKINALGSVMNLSIRKSNEYPAWEYEKDSKVREIAMNTYKELTGKEATISAIHAGLECGLLKKILPNADMISYGPNLYDVHSVNEKISIKSVENMWKFTIKLLENLK